MGPRRVTSYFAEGRHQHPSGQSDSRELPENVRIRHGFRWRLEDRRGFVTCCAATRTECAVLGLAPRPSFAEATLVTALGCVYASYPLTPRPGRSSGAFTSRS